MPDRMHHADKTDISRAAPLYDCVIVGAGPAGLTAAIYPARYLRSLRLYDAERSRARYIPQSHNCPGFPGGISGNDLLDKLMVQAGEYDVFPVPARVSRIERSEHGFVVTDQYGEACSTRTVLLATGIVDVLPDAPWAEEAIQKGALRLCAICDAYEVRGRSLAVYGATRSALNHALFLRTYTARVAIVSSDGAVLDEEDTKRASDADLVLLGPPDASRFDGSRCSFDIDGRTHVFDAVYPMLGCHPQSDLARSLGAAQDEEGALKVDRHQQSTIPGLYVAGDVVSALNQISVAVGHAGVAATAIHHALGYSFDRTQTR